MQKLSLLDKLIYLLRIKSIKKYCTCTGKVIMDVGCGYNADFLRYIQQKYRPAQAIAYDLTLNTDFLSSQGVKSIQGDLNQPFEVDEKVDLIFATAILEHLHQPVAFLQQCYDALASGGRLLLTTPSVRSQPVLEFLAYRVHVISEPEIRDHKDYYDRAKLLDYFQQAGFTPDHITHRYFECRMNNLVVAQKP